LSGQQASPLVVGNNVDVEDPSDLDDHTNWIGGFYELAIELGPRDDARLERMLVAIWRLAKATGPFVRPDDGPSRPASLNLESLGQLLHGVVRLPNGSDVVCGAMSIRGDGPDCLIFYVPVGALERTDPRIAGFTGDEDPESLVWRRPLDRWLADLAIRAYAEAPFQFATIGWEAFAVLAEESARATIPLERHGAFVRPFGGVPHYYESTT
jgi:hypothetical protein